MQELMDEIDIRIQNSNKKYNISGNYNQLLMDKIVVREKKKSYFANFNMKKSPVRITAASLIIGGIMLALMSIPSVQYQLVNIQCKIKNVEATLHYNNDINF